MTGKTRSNYDRWKPGIKLACMMVLKRVTSNSSFFNPITKKYSSRTWHSVAEELNKDYPDYPKKFTNINVKDRYDRVLKHHKVFLKMAGRNSGFVWNAKNFSFESNEALIEEYEKGIRREDNVIRSELGVVRFLCKPGQIDLEYYHRYIFLMPSEEDFRADMVINSPSYIDEAIKNGILMNVAKKTSGSRETSHQSDPSPSISSSSHNPNNHYTGDPTATRASSNSLSDLSRRSMSSTPGPQNIHIAPSNVTQIGFQGTQPHPHTQALAPHPPHLQNPPPSPHIDSLPQDQSLMIIQQNQASDALHQLSPYQNIPNPTLSQYQTIPPIDFQAQYEMQQTIDHPNAIHHFTEQNRLDIPQNNPMPLITAAVPNPLPLTSQPPQHQQLHQQHLIQVHQIPQMNRLQTLAAEPSTPSSSRPLDFSGLITNPPVMTGNSTTNQQQQRAIAFPNQRKQTTAAHTGLMMENYIQQIPSSSQMAHSDIDDKPKPLINQSQQEQPNVSEIGVIPIQGQLLNVQGLSTGEAVLEIQKRFEMMESSVIEAVLNLRINNRISHETFNGANRLIQDINSAFIKSAYMRLNDEPKLIDLISVYLNEFNN